MFYVLSSVSSCHCSTIRRSCLEISRDWFCLRSGAAPALDLSLLPIPGAKYLGFQVFPFFLFLFLYTSSLSDEFFFFLFPFLILGFDYIFVLLMNIDT